MILFANMASDENLDSLSASVSQYEIQLIQVQNAIAASAPGQGRDELVNLAADIGELITLTQENISSLQQKTSQLSSPAQVNLNNSKNDDPFADEYELFKSEIEGLSSDKPLDNNLENSQEGETFNISDIQDELEALQGMKCQAPYVNHYGHTSYHNALVYCVDSAEDASSINEIQVKVMFTNPVERDMLPCPYFLDGECRFSGDKCRYSHGESVCLASLQEYREPRFSTVKPGSRVLAKNNDNLWYSAEVLNVNEGNICTVKLALNAVTTDINLHDILPLDDEDEDKSCAEKYSSSDSDSDEDVDISENVYDSSLIEKSLLIAPSAALGEWEKHTKGIGSSIMSRMGYVTGTGLGKHGEGRIEPVEALVFPTGKSLDHCMNLKEQAAEGEDLFKVEKRLRRLQKKEERIQKRLYERKTQQKRLNIFDFINSKVGHSGSGKPGGSKTNEAECSKLKTESNRSLNVVGFRLGEDIRKVERDVIQLQEAVERHSEGSQTRNTLMGKLQEKKNELQSLRNSEKNIDTEKARRRDHKKLSVF